MGWQQGAKIVKSSHFLKMFSLGRKISLVCVATGKPRSDYVTHQSQEITSSGLATNKTTTFY